MPEAHRPFAAAMTILPAMAVIALADTFFIRIAEVLGLWQFHFVRALIVLPILAIWARLSGTQIVPNKIGAVLFRGLFFGLSMLLYFGSLAYISVPQAAAGLFSSPLWVLILTALVLRQKIGPRRIGAVGCGFIGVLIVLQPDGGLSWAQLMPVAGGFCYALSAISTRTWCQGETTLSLLAGFTVWMIILGGLGVLLTGIFVTNAPAGAEGLHWRYWGAFTPEVRFWFAVQVFTVTVAVYGLTLGYQLADASYASVFEYSFIVFAAFWAALFFFQIPSFAEVIGIALIIVSGVLIALSPAAQVQIQPS